MKFFAICILLAGSVVCYSQVLVRNVEPVNVDQLPYPSLTGNVTSTAAYKGAVTLKDGSSVAGKVTLFKKKGEFHHVKVNTGDEKREIEAAQIQSIKLEPKIFEAKHPNNYKNPEKNFQPGYIILPDGNKLSGRVAQVRDFSDYDFFIYAVLFVPQGSEVASTFRAGRLVEFGQTINGDTKIWDGYADGYLVRMVDGPIRLSRNPYSKTKNEFFNAVKNQVADSLGKEAARKAFASSLKNGDNINESIENASNAGTAVSEVLGSVEVNKKEYLIFDTKTNSVTAVNKDSFKEFAATLSAKCNPSPSSDLMRWDKIEDFIRAINTCR